jgi:hypothetical protein
MGERRATAFPDRFNRLLLRHPLSSTALLIFLLFLTLEAGRLIPFRQSGFGDPLAWVALGSLIYAPVVTLAFPRVVRRRPHEVLAIRWAFASSPTLFAYVALIEGAPRWLVVAGFLESTALVLFTTWSARRSHPHQGGPADPMSARG